MTWKNWDKSKSKKAATRETDLKMRTWILRIATPKRWKDSLTTTRARRVKKSNQMQTWKEIQKKENKKVTQKNMIAKQKVIQRMSNQTPKTNLRRGHLRTDLWKNKRSEIKRRECVQVTILQKILTISRGCWSPTRIKVTYGSSTWPSCLITLMRPQHVKWPNEQ